MLKYTVIITPEGEFPLSSCQIFKDEIFIVVDSYEDYMDYVFKLSDCKIEERDVQVVSETMTYQEYVDFDRECRAWLEHCTRKAETIFEKLPVDKVNPADRFCNMVFGTKIYDSYENVVCDDENTDDHPFYQLFDKTQCKYRSNPYLPNSKELDHLGYNTQYLIDYWRNTFENQKRWEEMTQTLGFEKPHLMRYFKKIT